MSPLVKPQRKQETERLSPFLLVHEQLFITLFVKKKKEKEKERHKINSIVQYSDTLYQIT